MNETILFHPVLAVLTTKEKTSGVTAAQNTTTPAVAAEI
jgi:hypothetical protein